MTTIKIIEMARKAGFEDGISAFIGLATFKRFEALVRADEQKKWQEQTAVEIHEAVLDEREACAKICDELVNDENTDEYINAADWCSVRIRARGATHDL